MCIALESLIKKRQLRKKSAQRRETYLLLFLNIFKYCIILIALISVLQINGVNVTSLVAGLGIAGAIIGLALQDALRDIIMGFNILSDEFYMLGDVIQYDNTQGIVIAFTPRSTKLRDIYTGDILTISNRCISQAVRVSNILDISVGVPYEQSSSYVISTLNTACEAIGSMEGVEKCTLMGLDSFGASAVNYLVRINCAPKDKPQTKRDAQYRIFEALVKAGISIPYQQIDVHTDTKTL